MKYCLFAKRGLDDSPFLRRIKNKLRSDERFLESNDAPDLIIVVGGDGTFLKAAHEIFPRNQNAKFLAFNAGTIGFYNDFTEEDIDDIPSIVFESKYLIGEIDTIEARLDGKRFYAWNEFNITGLEGNIDYDLLIDNRYMEHYFGSGLIISSPTGSLAYNRSLHGAIIDPSLHLLEITEVAPINSKAHKTLGNSLIVSKERLISLKGSSSRGGYLYADGIRVEQKRVDDIEISYSKKKLYSYIKKEDYFLDRLHKTIDL